MKKRVFVMAIAALCLIGSSNVLFANDNAKQETVQEAQQSDYIFEKSDKEKLPEFDVSVLEPEKLPFARNEIYARHGYIFEEPKYQEYFKSKSWYKPKAGFTDDLLNAAEKYNIMLIKFYEKYHEYYEKNSTVVHSINKGNIYPAGKKVLVDLNGDGKTEKIQYNVKSIYDINQEGTLSVNGSSIKLEGYLSPKFAVVDIDKKDKYKEIIISDYGPSADYTSTFYIYKNGKLVKIGVTGGIAEGEYAADRLAVDGSGTFIASTRGSILQTWWFDKKYQLDKNHKIVEVPTSLYTDDSFVYIKKDFELFTEKNPKSSMFTVKAGETAVITGNDNKTWCRVKTENGKEGWFRVKGFTYMIDAKQEAADIFAGLCYAD